MHPDNMFKCHYNKLNIAVDLLKKCCLLPEWFLTNILAGLQCF
jgi:hypothetical protein